MSGGILLIAKSTGSKPVGGRELLSHMYRETLREICSPQFHLLELPAEPTTGLRSRLSLFRGHIDGVSIQSIDRVLVLANSIGVKRIFLDGSNLGVIAAAFKRSMPNIEILTFFHNVETRFFWGSWRSTRSLHALAVLAANYVAERKAVLYSDKRVCMSIRDSKLLEVIFGMGATHISPMVVAKTSTQSSTSDPAIPDGPYALFVGGAFYANILGISWFVREVASRISVQIVIVGHGFENLKSQLEINDRIKVVGPVHNLADWYGMAKFVIAPIFDGSGMKTKVAEALMFGKKIVGTPEAFSGYETICEKAGWVCETADEFVEAISMATDENSISSDLSLRAVYEENFSQECLLVRVRSILDDKI